MVSLPNSYDVPTPVPQNVKQIGLMENGTVFGDRVLKEVTKLK